VRWVALLLLPAVAVSARDIGDSPIVRAAFPEDAVRVGAPATLRVTVLVPTWFPKAPVFPSFELPNAIVRLPPDSSYPISERVGGETWSGITRNYEVYPLLPATYRLSGQSLRVTWADPPGSSRVMDVPVPAVSLMAQVPEGAAGLDPYLAGRSFTLERTVEGELQGLEVGDALVVEYTAELDGLPAIFLPPLVDAAPRPGLAIYADEPQVEDGDTARRTERLTLVFELGGGYALPAPRLRWFDTDSGEIRVAEVPPLTIEVTGAPAPEDPDTDAVAVARSPTLRFLAALLLIGGGAWLARLAGPRLSAWRAQRLASEAHAFRQLTRTLAGNDARACEMALYRWLGRLGWRDGPIAFARRWGDAGLVRDVQHLSASRFGREPGPWQPSGLSAGLSAARQRLLAAARAPRTGSLPAVNP